MEPDARVASGGDDLAAVATVLERLRWMRAGGIWPNRWRYLDAARAVVAEVDRAFGRVRGFRIGEAADRDGQ